jgi:Kazal-type serine protease inhibitor domain
MQWMGCLLQIGLILPALFIANDALNYNVFAGNAFTAASQNLGRNSIWKVQGNPPEVCTQIYQPVCGTDPNGSRVTYSNECFARMAKATNITPGECPK